MCLHSDQVLTSLGVVFDMPKLPFYDDLMTAFSFLSLDFVNLAPLGCVFPANFHVKLVLRTAVPLGVVLALAGLHAANEWRLRRLAAKCRPSVAAKARGSRLTWLSDHGVTAAFFLIFLIYPSNSAAILSFFQCFPVDDGHSYLRRDFSIDCDGDAHRAMTYYALAMVLIYPLGVPLLYWATFRAHGSALRMLRSTELLRSQLLHAAAAERQRAAAPVISP